jgi:hypothetical protein
MERVDWKIMALTLGGLSATAALSGALLLAPLTSELHAAEKVIEPLVVGWERYFTFEWEVVEQRGQPVVRGYVTNDSPYTVSRTQLLLDALDGTGRVVAQQVSWIPGTLTAFSRVYFEIPAQQRANTYRVRMLAYDRLRN